MQGLHPDALQFGLPPRPDLRVGRRQVPGVEQRLDVHHRPTDDDGGASPGTDVVDDGDGGVPVGGDRGGVRDLQDVEEMVRDAAAPVHRQLRGTDVHTAVELHRIDVDDLTVERPGQGEGDLGLAGPGGADDRDRAGQMCWDG